MRLSEERIKALADQILDRLQKENVVKLSAPAFRFRTEIERTIIGDLKIEDEIRRESVDFVRRNKNAPPEGSAEFETLVRKQMETLASKRQYVL